MSKKNIKRIISVIAILLAIAHVIFPKVNIDVITVSLIALAIIPWLESLFKSVELPGGLKLEFQDFERIELEAKQAGIIKEDTVESTADANEVTDYYFVELAKTNQSLALVSLRIEIERRVREIAYRNEIDSKRASITMILNKLTQRNVLSNQENATLRDMIHTLNQAAHGIEFDQRIAEWIIDNGPRIIYSLDSKINLRGGKFSHENPESKKHWIDISFNKHKWTTNLEWSDHINKHLQLWQKEIQQLIAEINGHLKEDIEKLRKFKKTNDNWNEQLDLEREFLNSIENLYLKIGREGQMIMATTFMNKHRERALELEEILRFLKE